MKITSAVSLILWREFKTLALNTESPVHKALLDLWDQLVEAGKFELGNQSNLEKIGEVFELLKGPGDEDVESAVESIREAADENARHGVELDDVEDPADTPAPAFPNYQLILELTSLEVVHVTQPRDDEDEILLTGGYSHGSGGQGRLNEWAGEVSENDEARVFDPPLPLKSVAIPTGTNVHFDATIILQEEDWASSTLASAIGVVISLALTAGVSTAITYLRASGLPSDLAESAQTTLQDFGITGVRSWFEELAGPELFEIIVLRATTDWAAANQPVTWRSWIDHVPGSRETVPHYSVGSNTHVGQPATLRESTIERSGNGDPTMRYIDDGGVYRLSFQFRIEGG